MAGRERSKKEKWLVRRGQGEEKWLVRKSSGERNDWKKRSRSREMVGRTSSEEEK